ncbi:MAG TPA: carboxypeptidase regulatory-like domain-containing protein [Acidobacteriaceae bacterium]|nr:carboxypeptidase regulatory-like domain-containing protein [Acidobacteriaceae bacterium]
MRALAGTHRSGHWYLGLLVLLFSVGALWCPVAVAQQASANVTGTVKDPSGAAIPNAQVQLTNVNTGVVRTTATNTVGIYVFPNVVPGVYGMQASANGFATVSQPPVTLQVGQTASFDFELKVGATTSTVTVNAAAPALETATAELGTVVSPKEMNDLPLNGRNFTQLLTILPGTVNLNTDQNSGGGGGWNGASIGQFSFPAVNGARNRSNMFILDGANDLNTLSGTYNYAPIVDAIQEFKSQGHNDLAEYGGAVGAMVSVVTKPGTNQYHGALWEFLRNEQMDSRGFFEKQRNPLRQNQFGASLGGPVSIPKLYNGKNRTFFFVAWEGYRFASKSETGGLGPTDAMRSGDFSGLVDKNGKMIPIYDPATTTLVNGQYTRKTFTEEYNEPNPAYCDGRINCIPASRINPISALYQTIIPHSSPTTVNGQNVFFAAPTDYNQDTGTLRFDQNFGNSNQIMFRYSQFDLQQASPTGVIGLQKVHVYGHNYIGHYTHEFSSTAFTDVYFGRNFGYTITGATHPGEDAAFISKLQSLGMSPFWMTLDNKVYAPQYTAGGYIGLSGSQLQASGLGDDWQFGGSFSKIFGRHTIKLGADFETNNFTSPIAYGGEDFQSGQTSSLGSNSTGGNSWASLLLGVPAAGSYRNIHEVVHGGWINGMYIQDQFKATSRLTLNLGFRNNMVYTPIYGSGHGGNFYTGEANPITGQYILNALPPDCSATQGAPCIPTGIYTASSTPAPGGLPPHAIVNPTLRVIKNSLANWAPRVGLAYRVSDKTVLRAAYSRFYDEWADITQLSQNFGGNWPAVNTIQNSGLNLNVPTATNTDPLGFGSGGAVVYPINDFSKVSQWMVDPNFRTPVFDQWNVGVQRQLPANISLDADYVGSNGRHEDWGPTMNTPQPGPGDPQARRPYPYMLQQWFDQSVGNSRYNALQVSVHEQSAHGVTFLAAYTLSKSNADGCNLGASCDSSNPYDRKRDYGTSDLDQRNVFTVAFTAQSPFNRSRSKFVSGLAGGWALNGIVRETSGQPYTVTAGGDPENIGCCLQERMNVVGNPNSGGHTPKEWFNTSAFAAPTGYTYGNEKVNPLVSQHYSDVDMSLFRQFHIGETRYFEFRAESFNLFNNVVFRPPDRTNTDANYGQVTSQVTGQNNQPATRQLQLSLKFYY